MIESHVYDQALSRSPSYEQSSHWERRPETGAGLELEHEPALFGSLRSRISSSHLQPSALGTWPSDSTASKNKQLVLLFVLPRLCCRAILKVEESPSRGLQRESRKYSVRETSPDFSEFHMSSAGLTPWVATWTAGRPRLLLIVHVSHKGGSGPNTT